MSSVKTLTTDQWAGELGVGLKDWEETKATRDGLLIEWQIWYPSGKWPTNTNRKAVGRNVLTGNSEHAGLVEKKQCDGVIDCASCPK